MFDSFVKKTEVIDLTPYTRNELIATLHALEFNVGAKPGPHDLQRVTELAARCRGKGMIGKIMTRILEMKAEPTPVGPFNVTPLIKGKEAWRINANYVTAKLGEEEVGVKCVQGFAMPMEAVAQPTNIPAALLADEIAAFSKVTGGEVKGCYVENLPDMLKGYSQVATAGDAKTLADRVNETARIKGSIAGLEYAAEIYKTVQNVSKSQLVAMVNLLSSTEPAVVTKYSTHANIDFGEGPQKVRKTREMPKLPLAVSEGIIDDEASDVNVLAFVKMHVDSLGARRTGLSAMSSHAVDGVPLDIGTRRYLEAWQSINSINFDKYKCIALNTSDTSLATFLAYQALRCSGVPVVFYIRGRSVTSVTDATKIYRTGGVIVVSDLSVHRDALYVDLETIEAANTKVVEMRSRIRNELIDKYKSWRKFVGFWVKVPLIGWRVLRELVEYDTGKDNYEGRADFEERREGEAEVDFLARKLAWIKKSESEVNVKTGGEVRFVAIPDLWKGHCVITTASIVHVESFQRPVKIKENPPLGKKIGDDSDAKNVLVRDCRAQEMTYAEMLVAAKVMSYVRHRFHYFKVCYETFRLAQPFVLPTFSGGWIYNMTVNQQTELVEVGSNVVTDALYATIEEAVKNGHDMAVHNYKVENHLIGGKPKEGEQPAPNPPVPNPDTVKGDNLFE